MGTVGSQRVITWGWSGGSIQETEAAIRAMVWKGYQGDLDILTFDAASSDEVEEKMKVLGGQAILDNQVMQDILSKRHKA